MKRRAVLLALAALSTPAAAASKAVIHSLGGRPVSTATIDGAARDLMARGHIPGLAVALIEGGQVRYVRAYGYRDVEKALPLQEDTIMYGASLTKAAFAAMVMKLVDAGRLDIDRPIAELLPKPLPDYPKYAALADDPRWRTLTPAILLSHGSGLANFAWLEPDEKMRLHFDPGSGYAYSGEGINLLQFVLEKGLGLDVGAEMRDRLFQPLGMTRSSLTWRPDFAANMTTGYDAEGKPEPHDPRETVKAAGSLDTTVTDYAKLLAAVARGDLMSGKSRRRMLAGERAITTGHQFPTFDRADGSANRKVDLRAGLGWVVFTGPAGVGYYKGGHNDQTDNQAVCIERGRRCVLMMTNSGVGQRLFKPFVETVLGETGLPWAWEYNPVLPLEP